MVNTFRQRILLSAFIGLVATGAAMNRMVNVKKDIEGSVVRLHVVANSNTRQDQQLKIRVKNTVLQYLSERLEGAANAEETKEIIKSELQNISDAACRQAHSDGYGYKVSAQLGNFYFPTKQYDNAQFPGGNYDALRIVIGEGGGENWWCVLYPQLCFTSSPNGALTEEESQKLKNVLTEDEYNIIVNSKDGSQSVKIKFRLLELLRI